MCLQKIIEVTDLGFSYKRKKVLEDLSFFICRGEFFCIAGPNGAGKSTLLRILSGIIKPEKGNILFDSKDISAINPKELAKMRSVVDQNPAFDFISIEEFVSLGRIAYFKPLQIFENQQDRQIVNEALKLCNLTRIKNRRMDEISGGERQLAFLARAIAQSRNVLFLDEPFSNLDIANTVEILLLLRKLNRENKTTIITVLHDLNLSSKICDRIMFIKNGYLRAIGVPVSVMKANILEDVYGSDKITITTTKDGELCVSFLI